MYLFVGFPVEDTPSHIIPIRIGDPLKSTKISDLLMFNFGHYIQAINYPTVAKGEEKLRLAPTPFHKEAMMDQLVEDMKKTWQMLEMPLKRSQVANIRQYQRPTCIKGKDMEVKNVGRNPGHYATTSSTNIYIWKQTPSKQLNSIDNDCQAVTDALCQQNVIVLLKIRWNLFKFVEIELFFENRFNNNVHWTIFTFRIIFIFTYSMRQNSKRKERASRSALTVITKWASPLSCLPNNNLMAFNYKKVFSFGFGFLSLIFSTKFHWNLWYFVFCFWNEKLDTSGN